MQTDDTVAMEMYEKGDLKIIVDLVHDLRNGLEAFGLLSKGKANGNW